MQSHFHTLRRPGSGEVTVKDGSQKRTPSGSPSINAGSQEARCALAVLFVNQCVTVAQKTGDGFISSATASERRQAAERALFKCGDDKARKLVYEFCVRAARVK
jgi:hypothetical protein